MFDKLFKKNSILVKIVIAIYHFLLVDLDAVFSDLVRINTRSGVKMLPVVLKQRGQKLFWLVEH